MTEENSQSLEQQLLHAKSQIQQAERLAGFGFWEWDEINECLSYCSEGYAYLLGMTVEETIKASDSPEADHRFVHPDDVKRYKKEERAAYAKGVVMSIEYRILTATGEVRYLSETGEVIKDSTGKTILTRGIVQDISDSKLTNEKLLKTLADARRAERLANLGTYQWDWDQDRMVACSEEYARIRGMTVDEVLEIYSSREADQNFIHPDDRQRYGEIENEAMVTGKGYTTEYRLILRNGETRYMREICELDVDTDGKVRHSMGSTQDITEQVHLREQLHQAQKLEAIGQLTGGIAHDFNNMLTVIAGNVDLVMGLLGEDNPNSKLLASALRAAARGATLTQRLLAFSRKQPLVMQSVDLQSLVEGMTELLNSTLGETIEVNIAEASGERISETDVAQLESAILNIAINARDAMPHGGSFQIKVDNIYLNKQYTSAYEDLIAGSFIRLSFTDTGTGMSTEVRTQAFDPFYTTKDVGHGSGLGLSMVYGFIKQCHGHVRLDSEPGKGTVVELYLPVVANSITIKPIKPTIENTIGNGELILIVEDDSEVRELVLRFLGDLGYQTLEAENGAEGLSLLRTNPTIAMLFSDVVLPGGMNGVELAEEACRHYPDLKVLLTSGYTRESSSLMAESGYEFLEKPYSSTKLASVLSQVLASTDSATTFK